MTPDEAREFKNAIFAKSTNDSNQSPDMVSRIEFAKQELGIEIPSANVPLPSRGLVYPVGSALYNKENVDIKGMTTQEEDILTSSVLLKKGTVITELIRSCLLDPSISVNDLLSGDRSALMVAIRITGYGPEYNPAFICPNPMCAHKENLSINLSNLEIKPLILTPKNPGQNQFCFKLPISKKEVEFRFLTGKEEEEIAAATEAKRKKGIQIDNSVTMRLFYSILSIGGETDRTKISKLVTYMQAGDSLALRKYIDKHEPGIDMTHQFECKRCGHSEVIALPMTSAFFWPNS